MFNRYMAVVAVALAPALASAQGLAPEAAVQAALSHLDRNQHTYGVTATDLAHLAVTDSYTSGGLSHVYFRQELNGMVIVGTEVGVHFGRDGRVVHVAGQFTPGLAQRSAAAAPSLTAAAAAEALAREIDVTPAEAFAVVGTDARGTILLSDAGVLPAQVRANLEYLLVNGAPELAWAVQMEEPGGEHVWLAHVDALSGAILQRYDMVDHDNWGPSVGQQLSEAARDMGPWLFSAAGPTSSLVGSYRVYQLPVESPNHAAVLPPADGRTLVANPDVAGGTASPFGWHDTNGVAGPEFTVTRGNNVHAYTDVDNNDTPDPGSDPDGGAGLLFDFPLDLTQAPSAYRPAAVTNLFYWNNIQHDVLHQYGFDSPSGNFQVNTYGTGGLGNDDVRAEAQDGSGTNNANFFTPADGQRPRMQMYIWTAPNPDRDGDVDNGIILHEYGHGVSNRLTGGPAATGCVNASESPGEGWSDFMSVIFTIRPGDTPTTNRGVGTYALNQPTNGVGIRPAPYTTDFAVNNFTYQRTRTQAVPHGVGFVFNTILWEVMWELVNSLGGTIGDIYDHDGPHGNQILMRLVIEGMKLQPCDPGFVDARDAIIAADVALYGGAHVEALWEGFARRGLGFSASQGSSSTNADNTEAFNTPEDVPPGNITDLAVAPQGDFVNLTFTATGDDGDVGTAGTYDIRYSTTGPITSEGLFNAATPVVGEPDPQAAGTPENVVVSGLNFNTTYHFAMKVADENGNIGGLSNPASGTTLGAPVFVPPTVSPIVADVPSGGSTTVPVTIGNSGASALTYSVDLAEASPLAPVESTEELVQEAAAAFAPEESALKNAPEHPGQPQSFGSGGPDAFGYRWIDSDEPGGPTFNWLDISATGTSVVLSDDGEINIPLPFAFDYYGTPHTSLRLSSNGAIFFAASGDMPFTNVTIPNAATPNNIVAPFWDDLNPSDGGNIYHRNMGDGRFVISWVNIPRYAGDGVMTFQLILTDSGAIYYQYLSMTGVVNSATIGFENGTGTDGLQVVSDGAYVHNNLAIRISALWVEASVTTPTIPAGGTDTFDLVFDGSGLDDGTYHANMTISTNDPVTPSVVVPIVFNVGVVAGEPGVPAFEGTHLLTAVRPNPVETSASFTLAVRDAGAVSIALFDALGRRVATVFDGELSAGTAHQFAVDSRTMAAGAYVLRVEGDGFAESRRITLLR